MVVLINGGCRSIQVYRSATAHAHVYTDMLLSAVTILTEGEDRFIMSNAKVKTSRAENKMRLQQSQRNLGGHFQSKVWSRKCSSP